MRLSFIHLFFSSACIPQRSHAFLLVHITWKLWHAVPVGLDPTGELRRVNSSELDKLSCCSLGLSFLILGSLPLLNPRPALFQGLPPIELIYPTGVAKEISASIMASWTALVKMPLNLSHISTPLMLQCLQSLCLIQLLYWWQCARYHYTP